MAISRNLITKMLLEGSFIKELPIANCNSAKELSRYFLSSYDDLSDNKNSLNAFCILIPLYCLQAISFEELKYFFCLNYYKDDIKSKADSVVNNEWNKALARLNKQDFLKYYMSKKNAPFGKTYYFLTKKGYDYVNDYIAKTTQSNPEYSLIYRNYRDFVDITSPIFSHNFLVGINYMCLAASGLRNINWSTSFYVGNYKDLGRSKGTVAPDATCTLNDSFGNKYTMYFEQDMFTEETYVLVNKLHGYFLQSTYLDVVKTENGVASTNINTGMFISFGEKYNEVFNKKLTSNILKKHLIFLRKPDGSLKIEGPSNNICSRIFEQIYYTELSHDFNKFKSIFDNIEQKENQSFVYKITKRFISNALKEYHEIRIISSIEKATNVVIEYCLKIFNLAKKYGYAEDYNSILSVSDTILHSINVLGFEDYKDHLTKKTFERKCSILADILNRLLMDDDDDCTLHNLMYGFACFLYSELDFFQVMPYFFIKEFGMFDVFKSISTIILGSSGLKSIDSISTVHSKFTYKPGQTCLHPDIKNVFTSGKNCVCFEDIFDDVGSFYRMIVARKYLIKHSNFEKINIVLIVKDEEYASIFFNVLRRIDINVSTVYEENSAIKFLFINKNDLENERVNTYNLVFNGDDYDKRFVQF